jgi:hypothetical protein
MPDQDDRSIDGVDPGSDVVCEALERERSFGGRVTVAVGQIEGDYGVSSRLTKTGDRRSSPWIDATRPRCYRRPCTAPL